MTKGSFIIKSSILNKRKFMRLSATSKTLYFYLNADADDDGIVDAPMTLQKSGLNDNDLIQLSPDYITLLDSEEGVIFINHWTKHNTGLEMRKHHRSEYFDLLVSIAPDAKVFVGETECKLSDDGKLSAKNIKREVSALEADQRAKYALLSANGALKESQLNQIELNLIQDNSSIDEMWKKKTELLISRGVYPKDAKELAAQYSEEDLMRYISFTILYANNFNETAVLTTALRQRWNINAIVEWYDCALCDGTGFNSVQQLPCSQCKGTGKLPTRKRKEN